MKGNREASQRWAQTLALWVGSLLVVLVTLGGLAGLAWWKYREIEAAKKTPPPPEMPAAVELTQATSLSWRNSTTSVGTLLAPRSITVNNELPGTVGEILFQSGAVVEADSILLRQDIQVEEAQLRAAVAREKFTHSTLIKNRQLAATGAVSPNELEDLQSQWEQAAAQLEELKAVIARKTIKAPFRGRVGLTDIHVGQYLAAGSMITDLQSIESHLLVDFTLSQSIVAQVNPGATVDILSEGQTFPATVMALDSQADRTTRNLRVRAKLDQPPVWMKPGDSVQVRIEFGPEVTLPAVPADAVRRSPQGAFVFLAEKDQGGALRAKARPVIVATSVGKMIGMAQGLKTGDQVVAAGSFKLQDGMLIAPADQPAEAESEAGKSAPGPESASSPGT